MLTLWSWAVSTIEEIRNRSCFCLTENLFVVIWREWSMRLLRFLRVHCNMSIFDNFFLDFGFDKTIIEAVPSAIFLRWQTVNFFLRLNVSFAEKRNSYNQNTIFWNIQFFSEQITGMRHMFESQNKRWLLWSHISRFVVKLMIEKKLWILLFSSTQGTKVTTSKRNWNNSTQKLTRTIVQYLHIYVSSWENTAFHWWLELRE